MGLTHGTLTGARKDISASSAEPTNATSSPRVWPPVPAPPGMALGCTKHPGSAISFVHSLQLSLYINVFWRYRNSFLKVPLESSHSQRVFLMLILSALAFSLAVGLLIVLAPFLGNVPQLY